MSNILITGAGGFLGSAIAKKLVAKGHRVMNFSRSSYPHLAKQGVPTICGDLSNYLEVEKALENIEVVFHVAAKAGMWGRYRDYYQTNTLGTENIIRACKKHKIKKLIYTSTPSVVFGRDDLCGQDEQLVYPKKYLCNYAETKMLAEKMVLESNDKDLMTVALRPHLIYGLGDPHITPRLIDRAQKGQLRVIGDGTNMVDVTHVENAAEAHIQAFEKLFYNSPVSGNAYFIGDSEPVNLWDFINKLLEKNGVKPVTKKISASLAFTLGHMMEIIFHLLGIYKRDPKMTRFIALQMSKSHNFSHEKAKSDFGYSPTKY